MKMNREIVNGLKYCSKQRELKRVYYLRLVDVEATSSGTLALCYLVLVIANWVIR
jgi:hypothetical protein